MHTNDYTLGLELKSIITLYYVIMESNLLPEASDLGTLSLETGWSVCIQHHYESVERPDNLLNLHMLRI